MLLHTQKLFLDTRDGDFDTNYRNQWQVKNFRLQHGGNFRMALASVSFPNTVYPVNQYSNTFTFREDGTPVTITLAENNYTGTQMATYLSTEMTTAGTGTYTVTYSTQSKKLTFSWTGITTFSINSADTNTALNTLGLTTAVTGTSPIAAPIPVNLQGTSHVQVISNIGHYNYSSRSGSGNVFMKVPMNYAFGEVVHYEPASSTPIDLSTSSLGQITMELRDNENNPFELPSNAYVELEFLLVPLEEKQHLRLPEEDRDHISKRARKW